MRRALILMAFSLAACGGDSTTPSIPQEEFELPADQVAFDVSHNITKDGVRTAVLQSDTALVYEEARRFDVTGVRVDFYQEDGTQAGTLTAKTGEYSLEQGAFIARDSVVLITGEGETERRLETDELHYDIRADRIWTETAFTLYEQGRKSKGTSFYSDTAFRTWEVTGIQTEGPPPAEPGTTF